MHAAAPAEDRAVATERPLTGLLAGPLTARSVILSLLLGRRSTAAPVGLLVRWCGLFGIPEGTARVALSRSVALGELAAEDGSYRIVGRLAERRSEQELALAPGPTPRSWDGTWKLAVVRAGSRVAAERNALRLAAARLHLVELREGVWGRPDNLGRRSPSPSSEPVVAGQCQWWTGARPPEEELRAAVGLFGADAAAVRGRALLERLREVTSGLDESTLADAFVTGAAVAQFLRRDPLLPAELLPAGWPADDLRDAYATYRRAFGAAVATWGESRSVTRSDRPRPPAGELA